MSYSLRIKQSAVKALAKIPKGDRQRIMDAIEQLKAFPFAGSTLKGEFFGLRRIRIGDYRVIYEINKQELIILIVRVSHRREVYR